MDELMSDEEWLIEKFSKVIAELFPLVMAKTVNRVDRHIEDFGSVTIYWVNDIVRIDVKPLGE